MKNFTGGKMRGHYGFSILFLIVLFLAVGCGSKDSGESGGKGIVFTPDVTTTVKYVIDGDTLVTEDGEHIRFLGIDTPEIWKKKGDRADEPWGRDAANYAKLLLPPGTEIGLAFEAGATEGAYGRKLAYVIVDGELVNGLLLKEGYAEYNDFGNKLKYEDYLKKYQRKARVHSKGIWGGKGSVKPPEYFVASKNGKYYHASDSETAGKIKKKNKVRLTEAAAKRLKLKPGSSVTD
jgi:micrococcal nuclease